MNQFLRETGFSAQIGYDDVIKPLWERAVLLANIDLPFEASFYEEEWNRIVIAQEALTLEKYVKATPDLIEKKGCIFGRSLKTIRI